MTGRAKPAAKEETASEAGQAETPAPPQAKKERGDPWTEPCPQCGLLGCRRHA